MLIMISIGGLYRSLQKARESGCLKPELDVSEWESELLGAQVLEGLLWVGWSLAQGFRFGSFPESWIVPIEPNTWLN